MGVFRSFYVIYPNKDKGFCTLYARIGCSLFDNTPTSCKAWKHGFFAIPPLLKLGSWSIKTQWSGTFNNDHLNKLSNVEEKSIAFLFECDLMDIRHLIFSDLVDKCMFGDRGILSLLPLLCYI